jgi:glucose-1-phosphate adenylyltransferase
LWLKASGSLIFSALEAVALERAESEDELRAIDERREKPMQDVMGLIKLTEPGDYLRQLAFDRTVAAIPFGGRYRVIDFVLSNMVNAGIKNIGVVFHEKYRALMEHLRSGKEWDLHRKRDGLFFLPPDYSGRRTGMYKGDLENLVCHLNYLHRSRQKKVVLAGGRMIYKLDYSQPVAFHRDRGADITVLYKEMEVNTGELPSWTCMETDSDNRVVEMEVNSLKPKSQKLSMEAYIVSKSLLIDLIATCVSRGHYDWVEDGLIKNIHRLKIYGYPFSGYLGRITSVANYYRHSMDLLNPLVWQELFFHSGHIYTKTKDDAPTKYLEKSVVKNSLIASGCVIEGQVENSILFRGVHVGPGARIKDSVLLPKVTVEAGAVVQQAILDKEAVVTRRKFIKGDLGFPFVVGKSAII